jgi:tetratricopeptide (TPR) repeat protein
VGRYQLARQKYIKAKELDMLRFRAPEAMNRIIIALAAKYKDVHLVHTLRLFEEKSPHQILGRETILDHVHPDVYGYALLSEAFYRAIERSGLIKSANVHKMSFAELLKRMPITKVDSVYGRYTIMMLESRWPFDKPIPPGFKLGNTIDERLAGALSVNQISWLDAMNRLFEFSMNKGDKLSACKAVEAVMMQFPLNTTYKIYAGRLNYELGNYADAVYDMKAAYDLDPTEENIQNMNLIYLKTDQPVKAVKYIEAAGKMHPDDNQLKMLLATVKKIATLENKLKLTPAVRSVMEQIAADYKSIGAPEVAGRYLEQ